MKRIIAIKITVALIFCAVGAALLLQHCSESTKKRETFTVPELEAMCVHMVSCEMGMDSDDFASVSGCMNGMMWMGLMELGYVDYDDIVSCLINAGSDCDRIFSCLNEGHPMQSCDESTYEAHCEGDMEVQCNDGWIDYFDCSRLDVIYGDTICTIDPDYGGPECESSRECGEFSTNCVGNTLEVCIDGEYMRMDCRIMGARCREYMGMDYCVGTGPSCSEEFEQHCDGSSIVMCMGGKEARFDCADELGSDFTCFLDPDYGEAECGPRGRECDGEDHEDRCEGTEIVYCRYGFIDKVDCSLLGYSACEQIDDSAFCR